MFGINSINGSVQWLGVPDFLRTDGPAWTANLLDTHPSWGDQGSSTNPNWGSQYGGHSDSVLIPWDCPVCVLPVYRHIILENSHTATRRVHNNLLQGNSLLRMQSPSTCCNPIRNWRVNRWYYDWDGLIDQ